MHLLDNPRQKVKNGGGGKIGKFTTVRAKR